MTWTEFIATLLITPILVIGISKGIEIKASYTPPSKEDIIKIEKKSQGFEKIFLKNIKAIRLFSFIFFTLCAYLLIFCNSSFIQEISIIIIIVFIVFMSLILNWRKIFKI